VCGPALSIEFQRSVWSLLHAFCASHFVSILITACLRFLPVSFFEVLVPYIKLMGALWAPNERRCLAFDGILALCFVIVAGFYP